MADRGDRYFYLLRSSRPMADSDRGSGVCLCSIATTNSGGVGNGMRSRVSKAMWWIRAEARGFLLRFVCAFPLGTGDWIRSLFLPRFLGGMGKRTIIKDGFRVTNPERVQIGSDCTFAIRVFITGGGGVTIGNFVGIGPDAKIWSVNHRYEDPDTPWLKQDYERASVTIEDDVWLGANCFIMPGCTIGKGAIVSAGTVLMKSVPPYALVAGNPGRVVGWRKKPDPAAADTPAARADADSTPAIPSH